MIRADFPFNSSRCKNSLAQIPAVRASKGFVQSFLSSFAAAALLCTVTACNKDDSAQQVRGTAAELIKDACALLSKAEAEIVLSTPVAEPTQNRFGGASGPIVSNCAYHSASDTARGVSLLARVADSTETSEGAADRYVQGLRSQFGQAYSVEPVEGFPNGAIWDPSLRQLAVFTGADMLLFSLHGTSPQEARSTLEGLARTVLQKLS